VPLDNEQTQRAKIFYVKFVFTITPFLFFGCLFVSLIKLLAIGSSNTNSPTQLSLWLIMIVSVFSWIIAWRIAGSFSDH